MRLLPLLLLAGCAVPAPAPYVVDPLISFTDGRRLVLLSPAGYALDATLDSSGAAEGFLYRIGPDEIRLFRPAGGTPDGGAAERERLPRAALEGLRVRVTGSSEVELSGFRAGDAGFGPGKRIPVPYRVANP